MRVFAALAAALWNDGQNGAANCEGSMDLGLNGKTALVTGASRGIGLAITRALLNEGVSVVMVARTADRLRQVAMELRKSINQSSPVAVHPVVGDLGQRDEATRIAQTAFARLGHLDILINNAGSSSTGPFFRLSDEDLVDAWQVKALGYLRLIRAVAPAMMAQRSGNIIMIAGSTSRTPTPEFLHGSMVNAALINFTRGIARELAPYQVRINVISPGLTKIERLQSSIEREARQRQMSAEDAEKEHARAIPLHRLVSMDEIAALTLLLVSDQVPAITGEEIIVDGGSTPSI